MSSKLLYATSPSTFVKRLNNLPKLGLGAANKVSLKALEVVKAVPPKKLNLTSEKPPLLEYPEDNFRKRLIRDIAESKFRFILRKPICYYAGKFNKTGDVIEETVDKIMELLKTELPGSAYIQCKNQMFENLKVQYENGVLKESQDISFDEASQYYESLIAEEEKYLSHDTITLPHEELLPKDIQ